MTRVTEKGYLNDHREGVLTMVTEKGYLQWGICNTGHREGVLTMGYL